jgi:hypothetical protein
MAAQARIRRGAVEETLSPSRPLLADRLRALKKHAAAWMATCTDYYRAAALYDELSKRPDAELHRRGLSRTTLARDLSQRSDRTNG